MSESLLAVCGHCFSINRVPKDKITAGGKCGSCHKQIFTGQPVELTNASYSRFITKNQIPVIVDYWASWCGPCKMMAPVFTATAKEMEPHVRFAKVNTENEQSLAASANIRSIPTLVLYRSGKEVSRIAGAMDATNLKNWIQQNL